MARFGAGLCADADVVLAAERASADAVAGLGGKTPDLVCFFVCSTSADDFAVAAARVTEFTAGRAVIGCTAPGVLGAGRVVEAAASVSVWAAVLPGASVRTFHLEVMAVDDGLAVIGLPETREDDEMAVLLVDPQSFPADSFVEGLNRQKPGLPVVGGVAGSQLAGGQPLLFHDGRCVDRGAVGVFLGGPVGARAVVAQGCRAVGPPMVVTASERNAILSLANAPAAAKLEEVISMLPPDEQALASKELLLGIVMDEYADEHDSGDFVVRRILGTEQPTSGILLAGAVAVGTSVRLHVPDAEAAGVQLSSALAALTSGTGLDVVEGALVFTGRTRSRLFATADHEVALLQEVLGSPAVAGMLTGGEIGPGSGRNWLHSSAVGILAFGSGPSAVRGTRPV